MGSQQCVTPVAWEREPDTVLVGSLMGQVTCPRLEPGLPCGAEVTAATKALWTRTRHLKGHPGLHSRAAIPREDSKLRIRVCLEPKLPQGAVRSVR